MAAAVTHNAGYSGPDFTIDTATGRCSVSGNDNIYGLGIRLSIYVQCVTSCVAYCGNQRVVREVKYTATVFTLCLYIALVYLNVTEPSFTSLETLIVMSLAHMLPASDCYNSWERRHWPKNVTPAAVKEALVSWRIIPAQLLPLHMRMGHLWWFAFRGIKTLQPSPCGNTVFFFARVDAEGWFGVILKIYACLLVLRTVATDLRVFVFAHRIDHTRDPDCETDYTVWLIERLWLPKHIENPGPIPTVRIGFYLVAYWFPLVFTETALAWNNVDNVNNLGRADQLITLIVALGNGASLIWNWGQKLQAPPWRSRKIEWEQLRTAFKWHHLAKYLGYASIPQGFYCICWRCCKHRDQLEHEMCNNLRSCGHHEFRWKLRRRFRGFVDDIYDIRKEAQVCIRRLRSTPKWSAITRAPMSVLSMVHAHNSTRNIVLGIDAAHQTAAVIVTGATDQHQQPVPDKAIPGAVVRLGTLIDTLRTLRKKKQERHKLPQLPDAELQHTKTLRAIGWSDTPPESPRWLPGFLTGVWEYHAGPLQWPVERGIWDDLREWDWKKAFRRRPRNPESDVQKWA